jgi:hypothetical protein
VKQWREDRKRKFPTEQGSIQKNEEKMRLKAAGGINLDNNNKKKKNYNKK